MSFDVQLITLTPKLWPILLSENSGLTGKAFTDGIAALRLFDLRDFGMGSHKQVDDTPFGGGPGMVLKIEPLHQAIASARQHLAAPVILLGPRGRRFEQSVAQSLSQGPGITLVCGRYEGVDERVYDLVDAEYSIADTVLSAGDPAAWCIIDAVIRLLPGVLGNPQSLERESFSHGALEYPQYTRPVTYMGQTVPEVLRGGNHQEINAWREHMAHEATKLWRPDLLVAQKT